MKHLATILSPRGSVVLITLMVLMALGAISVLGVRMASTEIRSTRNHRMGRLVTSIADTSGQVAVGYAAGDPQGFAALVDARVFEGGALTLGDLSDVAPLVWDGQLGGSLGWLTPAAGAPQMQVRSNTAAFRQIANFPGSSAGRYCSRIYEWRIQGGFGASVEGEATGIGDTPMFGSREVLLSAQLGPFDCPGWGQ